MFYIIKVPLREKVKLFLATLAIVGLGLVSAGIFIAGDRKTATMLALVTIIVAICTAPWWSIVLATKRDEKDIEFIKSLEDKLNN